MSGFDFFNGIKNGTVSPPPMAKLFGIDIVEVEPGYVGVVRGEGRVIHAGRQAGMSEGRLFDSGGKLLAHGTTTCHIVQMEK
jgi:acyl-coenzyme A thioesterase PaaI-like protein